MTVPASPDESLLLAARVLQAAANQAEADSRAGRTSCVTESAVKALLWLSGSLLPGGRDLVVETQRERSLPALLQEAEAELRRFPIHAYPVGTIEVVIGLCDLIPRTQSQVT